MNIPVRNTEIIRLRLKDKAMVARECNLKSRAKIAGRFTPVQNVPKAVAIIRHRLPTTIAIQRPRGRATAILLPHPRHRAEAIPVPPLRVQVQDAENNLN